MRYGFVRLFHINKVCFIIFNKKWEKTHRIIALFTEY